ncbi:unnamed protein product [Cylindrotheca closterium]|uniref:Uncharacterized protein n=1 Tax=Cylindrotheca closterium TaxID=2856 RepID=A0AAD2CSH8_9STRA|nr:unnamed protein product [Cylindrotheca closterium]
MEHLNITPTSSSQHSTKIRERDLLRLLMTREMATAESSPVEEGVTRKVSFEDEDFDVAVKSPRGLDVFDSFRLSPHSKENKISSYARETIVEPDLSAFWQSNIAVKLFCPEPNETPEDAVNKMIDILERATTHPKNCWSIVKGSRSDLRTLKDEDLFRVFTKAVYIKETLYLSRSTINEGNARFSFRKCCNQVVQNMGGLVKPHDITAGYTVGEWFRDFRRGRGFTHYKCQSSSSSSSLQQEVAPLLTFFDEEPDLYKVFKFQLVSDIARLSAKRALYMFLKNIIPMASSKRRCESDDIILDYGLDGLQQWHFHEWLKDQDFVGETCSDSGEIVWTYMETVDM